MSTTLNTRWHSDFAKQFGSNLVQLEAQLLNRGCPDLPIVILNVIFLVSIYK